MGMFNQNSGFVKFVNRALDVLWLNLLWLIFSLPLITIGASTCAAFSVTLKMVDEEEGYVGRQFVKAFKENFKQGTLMWLITAPLLYACYIIWQVVIKADDINFLVILGAIIFSALVILVNLYTYPQIARYKNTLKNIVKNSVGISFTYYTKTLLIIVLVALEVVIISWNRYTLLAGIIVGPEFIIYTISGIAKKIFLRIEKHNNTPGGTENTGTINQ